MSDEMAYAECYVCGRPMDGLSEADCHCFHRKELLTTPPPAATSACASLGDVPVIPTIGD